MVENFSVVGQTVFEIKVVWRKKQNGGKGGGNFLLVSARFDVLNRILASLNRG